MTVAENIRRIRQMRGLTQKELGSRLGVSEAFIRAYESGRRNPKEKNLQAIADALSVNIEVLRNSDFDGIKAMHMLFQISRQYGGELSLAETGDGEFDVHLSFKALAFMNLWQNRYQEYREEVDKAEKIKDIKEKVIALTDADASYDRWMDTFPDSGVPQRLLDLQKSFDSFSDDLGKTTIISE